MGSGEVLRVGLVPELIDLKMFWGEIVLDYTKYNNNNSHVKKSGNKILKKDAFKDEGYRKYQSE